jgi:hypothetical protein
VELTKSYEKILPIELLDRYVFAETRNAAAVLQASNPGELLSRSARKRTDAVSQGKLLLAGSRSWLVNEAIDGDRADQGEGVDFPGHFVAREWQWSALQLKVEVRGTRVARIPDPSDDLARSDFLAHRHADRGIHQMSRR